MLVQLKQCAILCRSRSIAEKKLVSNLFTETAPGPQTEVTPETGLLCIIDAPYIADVLQKSTNPTPLSQNMQDPNPWRAIKLQAVI